jgi:hypothetical protein
LFCESGDLTFLFSLDDTSRCRRLVTDVSDRLTAAWHGTLGRRWWFRYQGVALEKGGSETNVMEEYVAVLVQIVSRI